MSKYDVGVGEAFELDESQPQDDCGSHHGRHHRHDHHRGHHDHDHDHHDRHGRHAHDRHHHMHLAARAMLFALKAYRHRMRPPAEQQ